MGRGTTHDQAFEIILSDRGLSEIDIGWSLSKLDSQEYTLDDCHYMARIQNNESENRAMEIFIKRYFSLNIRGGSNENNINNLFHECIDKKKMWILLEKNFGFICIKLPYTSVNSETYLFVYGPKKKCPELTKSDTIVFSTQSEMNEQKKQNPLGLSSLRLAG